MAQMEALIWAVPECFQVSNERNFRVWRNVIFECTRLNKCDQLESESAEKYITVLYSLVELCEYGDMKDEMLWDRLVVGIRNAKVSETLQMQANLTLKEANKAPAERSHEEAHSAATYNRPQVYWKGQEPETIKEEECP